MANGAYMSLSDWLSWLLHILGRYIHTEKNGTLWAHEGYLHPHIWKWAIPTPQVGSGRRTGWPYFVKSPLTCNAAPSAPKIKNCVLLLQYDSLKLNKYNNNHDNTKMIKGKIKWDYWQEFLCWKQAYLNFLTAVNRLGSGLHHMKTNLSVLSTCWNLRG